MIIRQNMYVRVFVCNQSVSSIPILKINGNIAAISFIKQASVTTQLNIHKSMVLQNLNNKSRWLSSVRARSGSEFDARQRNVTVEYVMMSN